jgi:hypothetical protein
MFDPAGGSPVTNCSAVLETWQFSPFLSRENVPVGLQIVPIERQ